MEREAITVFISASNMKPIYHEALHEFAQKTTDYEIIFGGDPNGMMGDLGCAILKANGQLTGITTEVLVDKKGVFPGLQNEIRTKDFDERKKS